MELRAVAEHKQNGLSLVGFLFVIVIVAVLAVLGMKIVPTVVEFAAIKKAIGNAKANGSTPREIQDSFNKQRTTAYISSVSGNDLVITPTAGGFEISIAYEKKIPLIGPASLVIDYEVSTSKTPLSKPDQ
ncbi:DUF4845 domain-containing protein [Herbaspirillum sp. ST 5-3]|uniref:DUF4845 domain-containing protein n=1 Tax=Oxalobacteraceae TaxID=75682 RepID=UPI0010A4EC79|nr:DUF4845 domain-containing protein [Herbaspirillum sp. ST 5-3]